MTFKLKNIFAFSGILLFCDILLPLLQKANEGSGSSIIYKVLAVSIYSYSFYKISIDKKFIIHLVKKNRSFFLLITLAMVSILWSVNVSVTIQKIIGLIGTTFFGLFLYKEFSMRDFLRILMLSFLIMGVISVFMVLIFPEMAIHSDNLHNGLWRGGFAHKNIMARVMALAIILSVVDYFEKLSSLKKMTKLIIFIICSILLLKSGGKTGILITFFLISVLYPILKIMSQAERKRGIFTYSIYFITIIGSVIALILLSIYFDAILYEVGGDITLTGRTNLWGLVIMKALESPWLGYGYGAFWESSEVIQIWYLAQWEPPHAHNGFLDLWLDTGLGGVVLFVFLLVRYIRNSFGVISNSDSSGIYLVLIIFYLLLYTIPGNTILSQNSLAWFLFVYSFFYAKALYSNKKNKIYV